MPFGELTHYLMCEDSIAHYGQDSLLTRRDSVAIAGASVSAPATTQKSTYTRKPTYYTVKSGDTLSRIASRNHCTIADLKKWNGLRSDRISIGQRLKVSK